MQKTVFIKLAVAIVSAGLFLGCDRPKSEETPADPPIASSENQSSKDEVSPAWGPPITRTLELDGPGKRCYADMDTGKIFAKPKNLSEKDLQEWIDKTGVDLLCGRNQGIGIGHGTELMPVNLATCVSMPKFHEKPSDSSPRYRASDAKTLIEKERQKNLHTKYKIVIFFLKPGCFYVFQTRDGRIGLLEFQTATENAATFTYRLQQEKPASQPSAPPTSQPAAKSAAVKIKTAFERIARRVSALEKTYPVLEGISNVQPSLKYNKNFRSTSAHWSFSRNSASTSKLRVLPRRVIKEIATWTAADPKKPFFHLNLRMLPPNEMKFTSVPLEKLKNYQLNSATWGRILDIYTNDPKLKQAVEAIIAEELGRIATPAANPATQPASQPNPAAQAAKIKTAFTKISRRISALEKTYPVLEGVSKVEPQFGYDPKHPRFLDGAGWSFRNNVAWLARGKNPGKTTAWTKASYKTVPDNPQKPFLDLGLYLRPSSYSAMCQLRTDATYRIGGETWDRTFIIQTDTPKLKKAIEEIVNEELNRIATLKKSKP